MFLTERPGWEFSAIAAIGNSKRGSPDWRMELQYSSAYLSPFAMLANPKKIGNFLIVFLSLKASIISYFVNHSESISPGARTLEAVPLESRQLVPDRENDTNVPLELSRSQISAETYDYDTIVYGDEVPGVCAAVWAKKAMGESGRVALVRPNAEEAMVGGLISRGGLAFLDLDKLPDWEEQPAAQCFVELLERAGVEKYCLSGDRADVALREMLAEAGVDLISDAPLLPVIRDGAIVAADVRGTNIRLRARSYIDATQDAELARKSGLAYFQGFESQAPELRNETLAVSVVPIVRGLDIAELQAFEEAVLDDPDLMDLLEESIREDKNEQVAEFWLRNFEETIFQDADSFVVRSVALSAHYHLYRSAPFNTLGRFFFDRGNVCLLDDGSLSWNGILFKRTADEVLQIEESDRQPPPDMVEEMRVFEQWLRELSGDPNVRVVVPPEAYVRHSVSVRDVLDPLTAQGILKGGTDPEDSIGSFSYDLDLRGGIKGLAIKVPPVPIYNFGIESSLSSKLANLAIVGRSLRLCGSRPHRRSHTHGQHLQGSGGWCCGGDRPRKSGPAYHYHLYPGARNPRRHDRSRNRTHGNRHDGGRGLCAH